MSGISAVVVAEGVSDQAALDALPKRLGRNLEAEGERSSFRTFQNQPAWRGQADEAQLRRFIGTKSDRKARYGSLLVDALDLTRVPRPLEQVLAFVWRLGVSETMLPRWRGGLTVRLDLQPKAKLESEHPK